jgi:hypothetical protein
MKILSREFEGEDIIKEELDRIELDMLKQKFFLKSIFDYKRKCKSSESRESRDREIHITYHEKEV